MKQPDKQNFGRGASKDYPLVTLDEALKVAEIVNRSGGQATGKVLSDELGAKGGWLVNKIVSTKRWGLISGGKGKKFELTELAKEIFYPKIDAAPMEAKRKAFLSVKLFGIVLDRFKAAGLPEDRFLRNILHTEYGVPTKDTALVVKIIRVAITDLGLMPTATVAHVERQIASQQAKQLVDGTLLTAAMAVGSLEALAEIDNDAAIRKESVRTDLATLANLGDRFPTLAVLANISLDELDSLGVRVVLNRAKHFSASLQKDLEIHS
jgi:hypothetical protein